MEVLMNTRSRFRPILQQGSRFAAIGVLTFAVDVHGARLLNVDFGAHLNPSFTTKRGAAALGSINDVWNLYSRDVDSMWNWRENGAMADLRWADGSVSAVDLEVTNAAGAWLTDSTDAMLQSYLYPLSRSQTMSVTLTEVPSGNYDLYFYAHGQPPGENGCN
jgi:hypothetical protein